MQRAQATQRLALPGQLPLQACVLLAEVFHLLEKAHHLPATTTTQKKKNNEAVFIVPSREREESWVGACTRRPFRNEKSGKAKGKTEKKTEALEE